MNYRTRFRLVWKIEERNFQEEISPKIKKVPVSSKGKLVEDPKGKTGHAIFKQSPRGRSSKDFSRKRMCRLLFSISRRVHTL